MLVNNFLGKWWHRRGTRIFPCFFCWLGKSNQTHWQGFFQGTDSCARSHEAMGIQHVLHPWKFNMIHLRISPGRRRFRTWKPSFSGSMLISVGVKSKKQCEPYPFVHPWQQSPTAAHLACGVLSTSSFRICFSLNQHRVSNQGDCYWFRTPGS